VLPRDRARDGRHVRISRARRALLGFLRLTLGFLPERIRSTADRLVVGLLLMLPMVLDSRLQLVTGYVSATPQRVITGFPYGIGQSGIVVGIAAWLVARRSESLMPSRRR
jgi:uncharacterized membrane protein